MSKPGKHHTTNTAPASASEMATPLHLDLAAQALLDGWTPQQVIAALIGRIQRDERYLAYRKACNRRTSYDGQVQTDMRAFALAVVLLEDQAPGESSQNRHLAH